jgi:HRDC domain
MVNYTFTTTCGHNGSIQTRDEGPWTWQCRGPKVNEDSGVHEEVSGGNRLYLRIAIARYLGISTKDIQIKYYANKIYRDTAEVAEVSPTKPFVRPPESEILAIPYEIPSHNRKMNHRQSSTPRYIRTPSSAKQRAVKSTPRKASQNDPKHRLEFSPSKKARCQKCGERILKGDLRVGFDTLWGSGPQKIHQRRYYHKDCCSETQKRSLLKEKSPSEEEDPSKASSWEEELEILEEAKRRRQQIIEEERADLRARLRKLRIHLHEKQGKLGGRALIISLETIDNIVLSAPTTETALLNVKGIGKTMLELYGQPILKEVRRYVEQEGDYVLSSQKAKPFEL